MSTVNKENLALMYDLARNARANSDATTAKKYYDMILAEDPLNWEPVFYSVYYTYATMKNGEIGSKTIEIKNCLNTVLVMVERLDEEEKTKALADLQQSVSFLSVVLLASSTSFYNSLPISTRNPADKLNRMARISELLFTMADGLRRNNMVAGAVELYKVALSTLTSESIFVIDGVMLKNPLVNMIANYIDITRRMDDAANYIRQTEPDYISKREIWMRDIGSKKKQGGGCYVATCVYGSYDCPQVWTLRRFRDDTLACTWYGRAFIRTYYAVSPTLVKWFGNTSWFKKLWKPTLDRMVSKLNRTGVENTPYRDRNW